ncbi:OmpA family protein [Sorangium sp. So ce375]|uniref:OmpA family protein n=1 Tax=Sorangium sp. So ce375 TaxID=3133306 RepID=UPI003F5AFBE6
MNDIHDKRDVTSRPSPRRWLVAWRSSRRASGLGPWVAGALLTVMGLGPIACGGVTTFEGGRALTVVGQPPAPPPPPPPPPPERVVVTDDKIVINEKIQFEYDQATIRSESHSLLDEVVATIKKHTHIKKIAIEGHASAEGSDDHNLKLSDRRAKAVMKYLVDHGIPAGMLTAKGFGKSKPIADNDSAEGREKNRRVEFNIVEQDTAAKTANAGK